MSHLAATIKETNWPGHNVCSKQNDKRITNIEMAESTSSHPLLCISYVTQFTAIHHSMQCRDFFFSHDLQILHHLNIASSHLIHRVRCLLKLNRKLLQSNPTQTCQVSLFQSCNPVCKKRDRKITFEKKVSGDSARTWYLTLATVGLPGLGSISRYRKQCEGATRQYWQSAAI